MRRQQRIVPGLHESCRATVDAVKDAVFVNVGEGAADALMEGPGNTTVALSPIAARRLAGHLLDAASIAERPRS
jgi:hypothetical protein